MSYTRSYKTLSENKCPYRKSLSKMLMSDHPIFVIKLDTTGLDPQVDQVIKIGIVKCHFVDYKLQKDDVFERLIKVNTKIPDFCFEFLNITQDDIDNAQTAEEVMKEILTFLGSDTINVVGFYTKDFIEPFLNILGFYSGHMLKIENIVDLYQMAISNLEPEGTLVNFKFRTICEYLGIQTDNAMDATFELFNKLNDIVPFGTTKAVITSSKYLAKGKKKYIILETECGSIGLNCNTGFFKEKTPGIFDVIDVDFLTSYICEKQNCKSIEAFIQKYESFVNYPSPKGNGLLLNSSPD